MTRALLRVEDLCIAEQDRAGFDMALEPGDVVGILGVSGSGKTHLLRTLARLRAPLAGQVLWDLPPRRRWWRRRGFVALLFANPYTAFQPGKPVRHMMRVARRSEDAALEHLQQVGLSPIVLDHRVQSLSGGQRVRLALACALLRDPGVVLVDDVFATLAPEIWRPLARAVSAAVGRERALVLASRFAEPLRMARHVVVFWRGIPIEWGAREALWSAPHHAYTRWLLGAEAASETELDSPDFVAPGAPCQVGPEHWIRSIDCVRS